jgi:hypothetical protein
VGAERALEAVVRLLSKGLRKALEVLAHEEDFFRRHFGVVERLGTESGKTEVLLGRRA